MSAKALYAAAQADGRAWANLGPVVILCDIRKGRTTWGCLPAGAKYFAPISRKDAERELQTAR